MLCFGRWIRRKTNESPSRYWNGILDWIKQSRFWNTFKALDHCHLQAWNLIVLLNASPVIPVHWIVYAVAVATDIPIYIAWSAVSFS